METLQEILEYKYNILYDVVMINGAVPFNKTHTINTHIPQ